MLTIQNYRKAESLEEAWTLNQKRSNRVIGGMLWLKMSHLSVQTAIDLSGLGLDQIVEHENEFEIGCMTTLRQLETHEGLNGYTSGAVQAALQPIVGVQFRNLATVGGSIYGRYGFSDVLTLFLAMESHVQLYKGGRIPLADYVNRPHDRDLIVSIRVPKLKASFFYQAVRGGKTDLPLINCAGVRIDSETASIYRVAIGARPGRAILIEGDQNLLQAPVTPEKAQCFAENALQNIVTGSNTRASAAYRKHLAEVLCRRAIEALGGEILDR